MTHLDSIINNYGLSFPTFSCWLFSVTHYVHVLLFLFLNICCLFIIHFLLWILSVNKHLYFTCYLSSTVLICNDLKGFKVFTIFFFTCNFVFICHFRITLNAFYSNDVVGYFRRNNTQDVMVVYAMSIFIKDSISIIR